MGDVAEAVHNLIRDAALNDVLGAACAAVDDASALGHVLEPELVGLELELARHVLVQPVPVHGHDAGVKRFQRGAVGAAAAAVGAAVVDAAATAAVVSAALA